MIPDDLPLWLAILVGICVLAGAVLTLVGAIGLARFSSFYERVHAPTLGTSLGTGFILLGSVLYFTITGQRLSVHEVLIFIFVSVTTPVTLMLLARAALYRDREEGTGAVPPSRFGRDDG
ncbi:monovalent cation/H(+) antiporter subunit G [Devosia sp. ZW T5_3]|uniref:monovalent cation/H(+) antiporter subunit G n=1 Tax=Devosia sp. ZW T5_3 TaxID=3378085 RepID=UPI00385546AB